LFRNYLKIALRNLRRNKLYSFINIGGLAVGLAACILILLYVQYEFSYDRFNKKADRIYRVTEQIDHKFAGSPSFIAPVLKSEIPGIQKTARLIPMKYYLSSFADGDIQYGYHDKRFYPKKGYFSDPSVFRIFTIPVLEGNPETGLSRPNTIFLSESIAQKFFGETDPLGKTIHIANHLDYEVTGVYKDFPPNSHIHANFMASFASIAGKVSTSDWGHMAYTYLLLRDGSKPSLVESQITNYVKQNKPEIQGKPVTLSLIPLLRIHLHSGLLDEPEPQSDIRYVYLFSGIALLVLLIAGFNYVNMTTARSTERAVETGIRKVAGAGRLQIASRFFCETFLLNLIALVLSVGLVGLVLPYFDQMVQLPISLRFINQFWVLGLLCFILLSISVIGGSYPSVFLSSFQPGPVLKGQVIRRSGANLRKGLVVLQFVISISLIICTFLLQNQMNFIQNHRPGSRIAHVIMIRNHGITRKDYQSFKSELLSDPSIQDVTTTASISGIHDLSSFGPGDIQGYNRKTELTEFLGDADFIPTFGLKIIKGRDFLKDHSSDENRAVIVNEAAVKKFGWKNPIGKRIRFKVPVFKHGKLQVNSYQARFVIGVVKDFNNQSLRQKVEPAIIEPLSTPNDYIAVRTGAGNVAKTISFIKEKWGSFVPNHPFDYTFLSDVFAAMYRSDYLLGRIFRAFALLAIFIACLGLFGLAALSAEQRTKEIGIRKVLGASVSGIVALLSKDFLKLVGIGFLIGAPIAWYAMHKWLQNFAYHIHIGIGTFALAGVLAMIIALATVSWQSIRAAVTNPVESLRNE